MNKSAQNLRIQIVITLIAIVLFAFKLTAWIITHSVAILTDALESLVNVAAGLVGVYSLYVAAKPKDKDHPYGHGKVEFLSAAFEGTLIGIAGLMIIKEAITGILSPHEIHKLDIGMYIIGFSAVVNYLAGTACLKIGKRNGSLALIASGRHLRTDMYTTVGILAGLLLLYFTGITWMDGAVAIIFAIVILVTAYRILRSSIAGIMDEADTDLLQGLIDTLEKNRRENWIDLHNLRVIKYGSTLHLDFHLTLPWYFNLHEAHGEIDKMTALLQGKYGDSIEFFVHSDGCLDFSCAVCSKQDCASRQRTFLKKVEWTMSNVLSNEKHRAK